MKYNLAQEVRIEPDQLAQNTNPLLSTSTSCYLVGMDVGSGQAAKHTSAKAPIY